MAKAKRKITRTGALPTKKEKTVTFTGDAEKEIEKEKDNDRKMLGVWKEVAITGIRQMLPPKIQPLLRFNTWEEAMRLLNNRDKKE